MTDNTCYMCPFDTFQPEKWQEDCIMCNDTYGTASTGSTDISDCQRKPSFSVFVEYFVSAKMLVTMVYVYRPNTIDEL